MLRFFVLGASFIAAISCQSSSISASSSGSSNPANLSNSVDLALLPICAQNCLSAAIIQGTTSPCEQGDIKCLCGNPNYTNALYCCVKSSCSTSDQNKAVTLTRDLCDQANVTIPVFTGCGSLSFSGVAGSGTASATSRPGSTAAGAAAGSVVGTSSSIHLVTPVTVPPTASAVFYAGGPLLTGSCTNVQFASATLVGGTILQYPWEGCASLNQGCCPFNIDRPGPLDACPVDYFTTSGACCPTGWSIYPSALHGTQTPCYTVPRVPLVTPTGLKARAAHILPRAASTSLIRTQIFTQRYPLVQQAKKLSSGGIAGATVGAVAGAILLATLLAFFIRRYRAIRKKQLGDNSTVLSGTTIVGPDLYDRRTSVLSAPGGYYPHGELSPNQLPNSATRPPLAEHQIWFPQNGTPVSPPAKLNGSGGTQLPVYSEPTELPGDEHLHAHHPAFGALTDESPKPQAEDQPEKESPTLKGDAVP